MPTHGQGIDIAVGDLDADFVGAGSGSAGAVGPARVVVAALLFTMASWLVSGRPRQFMEMLVNEGPGIGRPLLPGR